MTARDRPVISLFSGALGLDLGLEDAGFTVRVAVECDPVAAETIRINRPDIPLIEKPIEEVSTKEILSVAGLRRREPFVVSAGPSCQAFSTAGQRGSLTDPRGTLFREFLRVVTETRPRFYVMENVRGILSAAVKHRPLKERGPGFPQLEWEEQLGSAFVQVIRELRALRYYSVFDLVNSADFGVPQTRERLLFIGSRDGEPVRMPEKTHAKAPIDGEASWTTLRSAIGRSSAAEEEYLALPTGKAKYLRYVPEGGNWRDLPPRLQREALGGAYESWGGRTGFFRRLAWNRPAPALTTRPDSKATMFCHPKELRPLSVREYARIQQFPADWVFAGSTSRKYIQIGNAVPVGLGRAIGVSLRRTLRSRARMHSRKIYCARASLLERFAKGRSTVLNPPRMRERKSLSAAREWTPSAADAARTEILRLVEVLAD